MSVPPDFRMMTEELMDAPRPPGEPKKSATSSGDPLNTDFFSVRRVNVPEREPLYAHDMSAV